MRNLLFNASAGTGKTWQVTGLYSSLVLGLPWEGLPEGLPPVPADRILLVTFTDNAAAELRSRVAQKMIAVEREAQEKGDATLADRARQVLRRLPAAQISTIHAFCAGVVRDHALDLGRAPGFQTIDQDERDALLEEVMREEILRRLRDDAALREFCAGMPVLGRSEYSLAGILRSLLEKAANLGLDLQAAERLLPPPVCTVGKEDFQRVRDELMEYDLPPTARKALEALDRLLEMFPDAERLAALPKFGQAKKVRYLSDELADLKERFSNEQGYLRLWEPVRAFARCLDGVSAAFAEAKRERDCVDFGDQLLLARKVLRSGSVEANRFDWLIVDEVQDTSRVQCDVLQSLLGGQTRLVICGDPKQSIYAWRSADPRVMPDLEANMEASGGVQRIALRKSFRSKDRVLEPVNALFSSIWGQAYEEAALEPAAEIGAQTGLQGEGPCLEFLFPDEDGSGEGLTEQEMEAVARRIRLLVEGGPEWRPRFGFDGKRFREDWPVRYGDILILLKRTKCQASLEQALRKQGIPFTSGGKGRALFEQQEVRDVLLFLQTLSEPFNDQALAGFLRSPFASVSDDQLLEWAADGEGFCPQALRTRFFASGLPAAERLARFQQRSAVERASQLVREMVRETEYDAWLAGQPGGAQKLANLKKAIDWLRMAERSGHVLLADVVRRFEQAVLVPPRSGAAEALLPDPDQNAVTIMTVHGAKGLTRRVCFVPDISFGDNPDKDMAIISPEGRLEVQVPGLDGQRVKSPGWDAAKEADKAVQAIEQTNVFYVAMTRARDLTVVSGAGTKKPEGWLEQADAFLQAAPADCLRRIGFADLPEISPSAAVAAPTGADIRYIPLELPEAVVRRTVTSLCPSEGLHAGRSGPSSNPALYGTVGHAVLEHLAKHGWQGRMDELVDLFAAEFSWPGDARETLAARLEQARVLLREETSGAQSLRAEFPFVFRDGNTLFDGSIDLLAGMQSGEWKIVDYKFTEADPAQAAAHYAPQLELYRAAVRALYPGAAVSVSLLRIGPEVRLVRWPESGPVAAEEEGCQG